jgi:phage terminase large subunit-like protein
LGTFKRLSTLRNLALEAKTSISARREFERYHLNIWHDGDSDPWLSREVYDDAGEPFDLEAVKHLPCYVGVDAGAVSDLTAVVADFYDAETRRHYILPTVWCPAQSIAKRSDEDGVPYDQWKEDGYLLQTEGAAVDEDAIEARVRELCDEFDVRWVGFDAWQIKALTNRLTDDGLPMLKIAQSYSHMSPAMKGTEKAVIESRFRHGGHPVLRWAMLNVPLCVPNDQGDIKPKKSKVARTAKIDPAVAAMMAVYLAIVESEGGYLSASAVIGNPDG